MLRGMERGADADGAFALWTERRREGDVVVVVDGAAIRDPGKICVGFPPGIGGGGLYTSAREPRVGFGLFVDGSSPVSRSKEEPKELDGARVKARADGLCGTGGRALGFGCVVGALDIGGMGSHENAEEVVLLLGGGGGGRVFWRSDNDGQTAMDEVEEEEGKGTDFFSLSSRSISVPSTGRLGGGGGGTAFFPDFGCCSRTPPSSLSWSTCTQSPSDPTDDENGFALRRGFNVYPGWGRTVDFAGRPFSSHHFFKSVDAVGRPGAMG